MPSVYLCLRRLLALGAIVATLAVGLDLHWHPPCLDSPDACCAHDDGDGDADSHDDGQHCHCLVPAMLTPASLPQPLGLTQHIRPGLPPNALRPPRLAHAPDPPPIRAA
jgi:hypothetical protein